MIKKDNFKKALETLGFKRTNDMYIKKYAEFNTQQTIRKFCSI